MSINCSRRSTSSIGNVWIPIEKPRSYDVTTFRILRTIRSRLSGHIYDDAKVQQVGWKDYQTDKRPPQTPRGWSIQNQDDWRSVGEAVGQIRSQGCILCRYQMGLISVRGNLELCERIAASVFCRRRLATVLVQRKFCEHLKQAVTYIEQGRKLLTQSRAMVANLK